MVSELASLFANLKKTVRIVYRWLNSSQHVLYYSESDKDTKPDIWVLICPRYAYHGMC
jgi:hypothetical protein